MSTIVSLKKEEGNFVLQSVSMKLKGKELLKIDPHFLFQPEWIKYVPLSGEMNMRNFFVKP